MQGFAWKLCAIYLNFHFFIIIFLNMQGFVWKLSCTIYLNFHSYKFLFIHSFFCFLRFFRKTAGWMPWWLAWSVALQSRSSWRRLTWSLRVSTTRAWTLEGRGCSTLVCLTAFSKSSARKAFGASTRVGLLATSGLVRTRFLVLSSGTSFESCTLTSTALSISDVGMCA